VVEFQNSNVTVAPVIGPETVAEFRAKNCTKTDATPGVREQIKLRGILPSVIKKK
jgi:hypothetical protein